MRYAAYNRLEYDRTKKLGEKRMKKVIIIDDNKITADLLKEQLEYNEISVVGKGDDGSAGIQLCKLLNPDVVLYAMQNLEFDLQSTFENIKKENPGIKIILITDSYINFKPDVSEIFFKKTSNISELVKMINQAQN